MDVLKRHKLSLKVQTGRRRMKKKNLIVAACAVFAFTVFALDSNEAAAQCGNGGYNSGYRSFGYNN